MDVSVSLRNEAEVEQLLTTRRAKSVVVDEVERELEDELRVFLGPAAGFDPTKDLAVGIEPVVVLLLLAEQTMACRER